MDLAIELDRHRLRGTSPSTRRPRHGRSRTTCADVATNLTTMLKQMMDSMDHDARKLVRVNSKIVREIAQPSPSNSSSPPSRRSPDAAAARPVPAEGGDVENEPENGEHADEPPLALRPPPSSDRRRSAARDRAATMRCDPAAVVRARGGHSHPMYMAACSESSCTELHRGRGPLVLSPGALPAPPTARGYSPTTCWCTNADSAAAQCCSTIAAVPPVLANIGSSHAH